MIDEYATYTGIRYKLISDALIEVIYDPTRTWVYHPKRINNFFEVSLFSKHGLYKCRVYFMEKSYKFAFYYGTTLLGKTTRFSEYASGYTKYIENSEAAIEQ
jgi:hypothetical protein